MYLCIGNNSFEMQDAQQALRIILQYNQKSLGLLLFDTEGLEITVDEFLKGVFANRTENWVAC